MLKCMGSLKRIITGKLSDFYKLIFTEKMDLPIQSDEDFKNLHKAIIHFLTTKNKGIEDGNSEYQKLHLMEICLKGLKF